MLLTILDSTGHTLPSSTVYHVDSHTVFNYGVKILSDSMLLIVINIPIITKVKNEKKKIGTLLNI